MDLLLLVVIVLFVVIMEHIKTWSKTLIIKTKNGKIIQFKQNLNCTNFGVYAACCNICSEIYIGQTINRFSVR